MNKTSASELACKHVRTKLIAKDNDAEYVECLDCGALLEAQEISQPANNEAPPVDGSLSDA